MGDQKGGASTAFTVSRLSRNANNYNMTKLITDNPKTSQMMMLETYQR
jgi:hypothetical protein